MRLFIIKIHIVLLLIWATSCYGQENYGVRQPVVAGSFYPGDAKSLNKELNYYFSLVEDKTPDNNLVAIISPHAGYMYSGEVAANAYSKLNPQKKYSHIFIIGTSHHIYLNGASIYNQGPYKTPLGEIPVDKDLANKLIRKSPLIQYIPQAHQKEHSIEVQLPFLQYWLKNSFSIVPIIIGTQDSETCKKLAEILKPYFTPDNLFVISSDFSHYPSYANAKENDKATANAILSNSPEKFVQTIRSNKEKQIPDLATSCCGWSSILTMLYITSQQKNIVISDIKYMNSGDSPEGDKNRVVGYHAITFSRKQNNNVNEKFSLTTTEKKLLLKIARESIESFLLNNKAPAIPENELTINLKTKCGAFVTLTKNQQLRGCIGQFSPEQSLYKVVQQMALAAAFHDTRFNPVGKDELHDIDIEISVLTPLKEIYSIEDFKLGQQGIYIVKNGRSGTFLPQVAESKGWNKEEFLGHCARDKAGIGWNGWKEARLFTYEALIFSEEEFH